MTRGATGRARAPAGFHGLDPDTVLAAVESEGWLPSGHLLALNSYENRVYRVGLEDGGAVVAKFYRPGRWNDAAIEEELVFTTELAQAEIPVVAPLAGAGGRLLMRHAGYRFSVFPNVGGRAPALDDPDQLEELGRLTGRMHAIGRLRRHAHRHQIDIARFGEEPSRYLAASGAIPPDLLPGYEAICADILQRVRLRFQSAGAFAVIRVHGDCHPGNILVRDGSAHLVDFDDTANGPAIQDLWMFLSGDRAYREAGLTALMEGYRAFNDFDPRELVLIEPLRALRMIHYAAWLARRHDDPAFALAFPWFGGQRYWGEHILALREQLAELDEPALAWYD
ncbi:MAG: serine/threonine protein kinase [Gammaproteobacteria bacterium]